MSSLEGKAAIVTGSSSGVGQAVAIALAQRKCNVVVNYTKSVEGAQETLKQIEAAGAKGILCQANVSSDEDCKRLAKACVDAFGRIDYLVVGFCLRFRAGLAGVNVVAAYQMIRAVAPEMKRIGKGSIVNVSSIAGVMGVGSSVAYAASKGALNTMTLSLARVLGPEIRVNAVCPGFIQGRWLAEGMGQERYDATKKMIETTTPLRQAATPEEVKEPILFFLESGTLITGEVLMIDSGLHLGGKEKEPKKKWEPPLPTRVGKKKKRGPDSATRIPQIFPTARCKLRMLKMERIKDFLLLEEEFVQNQERLKPQEEKAQEERSRVDDLRGSPMNVGSLEEIIDDDHAIVSASTGPEYYVSIMSFVDKDILEPGCSILMHHKSHAVVGVLQDDTDPMVSVMKLEKAPTESYADVGGLDQQVQEIKESVELPLTHPELYEEMGIKPPKGVILYGPPGTGKTLLAKAVANQTSATFLRVVGSELIQKYLGDGPKLVRELFRVADEMAPSIVFIDEIDAIGTKRYDSTSGGEREIQRTMLELLNQLDGFDSRGDVKVIMATNRIETLDPALIRPGRIDRKIEFPLPDVKTKRRIFAIHTSRMTLADDVDLEEFVMSKDDLSGADIKAVCTEAGLLALRERRMRVVAEDFRKAKEKVLYRKTEGTPEGLYL
ncbi:P-loop containing nucleoside triphosphate hydrolase protein [Hyaloraphidium curvatum]|nr:P-loop containing nucleoside triphosphate hydrolase protein [Hyaloraphidium curvatum]